MRMKKPEPHRVRQISTVEETDHGWREARAALADGLDLREADLEERSFLGACQKLHRNFRGSTTPFEGLILALVFFVEMGVMPTPEMIEQPLSEFRENFADMKRDAAAFARQYPAELQDAKAAGSGAEAA